MITYNNILRTIPKYYYHVQNDLFLINDEYRICLEKHVLPWFRLYTKDLELHEAFELITLQREIYNTSICTKCNKCEVAEDLHKLVENALSSTGMKYPMHFILDKTSSIDDDELYAFCKNIENLQFGYFEYFYNQENIMKLLAKDLTTDEHGHPTKVKKIKLYTDKEIAEGINPNNLKIVEFSNEC